MLRSPNSILTSRDGQRKYPLWQTFRHGQVLHGHRCLWIKKGFEITSRR